MGEQADYIIDQIIEGRWASGFDEYGEYHGEHKPYYHRRRREATEVAEDVLASVKGNRNVKRLNEGVIKW